MMKLLNILLRRQPAPRPRHPDRVDDPFDHPEIRRMSPRQLADLPVPHPAGRCPAGG